MDDEIKSSETIKYILEQIQKNQEETTKDIKEINQTLAQQAESLRLHIYRTSLNEQNIEMLRTETRKRDEKLESDVEPIKIHVANIKGALKAFKIIASLSAFLGTIAGILKFFKIF